MSAEPLYVFSNFATEPFYDYLHRKPTEIQKKRKKTAAYIVMQFKRLKSRMGYRKLYHYLINRDVMVSLSQ
ncbi:hypothetical protein CN594_32760, partial [Bacillus toyonensis]